MARLIVTIFAAIFGVFALMNIFDVGGEYPIDDKNRRYGFLMALSLALIFLNMTCWFRSESTNAIARALIRGASLATAFVCLALGLIAQWNYLFHGEVLISISASHGPFEGFGLLLFGTMVMMIEALTPAKKRVS